MYIRKLVPSDAPLMLEWMHDPDISRNFRADFASMTIHDAETFIRSSNKIDANGNINAAVSSDEGEYMGTVSLKHIDGHSGEFAIVMRKSAMGKGFAWFGMSWIIAGAFRDLCLEMVWWNVLKDNARAVRFYDKHNFKEMIDVPEEFVKRYENMNNLKWYCVNSPMTKTKTPTIIDSRLTTHDSRLTHIIVFIGLRIDYIHTLTTKILYLCSLVYVDRDFFVCSFMGGFLHAGQR